MSDSDSHTPSLRSDREVSPAREYSDQECAALYALARHFFATGALRKSEVVVDGLLHVAPAFAPAWILRGVLHINRGHAEDAEAAARQALRADATSLEASVLFVSCLLSKQDLQSAGTFLGEIGERMGEEKRVSPELRRIYESQLVRYQSLTKRGT